MSDAWPTAPLGEIAATGSGSTPKADNTAYYGNGIIPFVRIADLNDGEVSATELAVTEAAVEQYRLKLRPPGTLLIAMYGSIGKLGLLQIPATTNQAILAVSPNEQVMRTEFLFSYFLSHRNRLINMGFGGVQKNLSGAFLKKVLVPTPPLEEQDRVIEVFRAIHDMGVALDHHQSRLETLLSAVLREVFADEPPAPTDAP